MFVFIYNPQYNIPGIGSFKKEMVQEAGFEPRIFQLWIQNLQLSHLFFMNNKVLNKLKVAAIL